MSKLTWTVHSALKVDEYMLVAEHKDYVLTIGYGSNQRHSNEYDLFITIDGDSVLLEYHKTAFDALLSAQQFIDAKSGEISF
jgi:hypothetical protein